MMQFKQFSVRHDRVAMKVGMDGVLLGAWAQVHPAKTILDIGTGSGLIALMLAQRTPDHVRIDAVEISDDAQQAAENFSASPWKHRLRVFHKAVQEFQTQEPYDLLAANPPYFAHALKPPDRKRETARHDLSLRHDEIIATAARLLAPAGRLSIILPTPATRPFEILAAGHNLYCARTCDLSTKAGKPPIRRMMELVRTPVPPRKFSLSLLDADGQPTAEYRALVADFYLNF